MKEIDRFLKKVAKLDNNDCWLWKASKTQQGYGMFSYKGKSVPAHRFSYLYHKKEICQNNACVNPEHLIICSKSESRLKYNSTRVHPDAKKLIQNLKVAEGPAL